MISASSFDSNPRSPWYQEKQQTSELPKDLSGCVPSPLVLNAQALGSQLPHKPQIFRLIGDKISPSSIPVGLGLIM